MPRDVLEGSVEVLNQRIGTFPEPRFRFVKRSGSSSFSGAEILACFRRRVVKVVSFRDSSSSSSESSESEPDRLSSRSKESATI